MTDNNEIVELLKGFIREQKQDNDEINKCLKDLKNRMTRLEANFENCSSSRQYCYKQQEDMENRMREVEKPMPTLKKLPEKMDALTIKVYTIAGALTILGTIAGIWIKIF